MDDADQRQLFNAVLQRLAAMQTLYAVACLALLGLYFVQAQLPQYPIYPDLGGLLDLGAVLPATPATFSGTPDGAECDLSQCQGSMDTSTASFDDSGQTILICNCDGAQLDPNALVYGLGQVPLFLRQNVKGVTAIPSDTAHAYTAAGRITIFGFVEPDVFIHEATHAQDNGFSSSSAFKEALADDPCVPDAYAQINEVECYAQGSFLAPTSFKLRACAGL